MEKQEIAIQLINSRRSKKASQARELLFYELGGFFNKENFASLNLLVVAEKDDRVIGAAGARENKEKEQRFFQVTDLEIPHFKKALYLTGLVVKKEFRDQGIGQLLLQARTREAKKMGYDLLLGDAWLESPDPSRNLLLRAGMKEAGIYKNFWQTDQPIKDYCSRCGSICSCTAILFYQEIKE